MSVSFAATAFSVSLADGRSLVIPLDWYPRLQLASLQEREDWQLLGDGYAIQWPAVDEHISTEGLVAGRKSGESVQSLDRFRESRRSI
ncbi:MAG: DUF2442 domain-containing protein [Pirellulaceae bacterium]